MTDVNSQNNNFHTRLAVIEKDLAQLTQFLGKLESTMEKLSMVLASLKETIILHDLKITNHEKVEVTDSASFKDILKRLEILEQFRWYASGAVALLIFFMPFVYKVILKM